MIKKIQRKSNFELLRIVAMLMIICYHVLNHCVRIQLTDVMSMQRWNNGLFNQPVFYGKLLILAAAMPFGQIGNAVFILISGYFLIKREKKIDFIEVAKNLLVQLGFATIVLVLISTIYYQLSENIFVSLMDIQIFNTMSWFIGYYFAVILIGEIFLKNFLLNMSVFC